ncbi:MAG: hypothetical protein ACE5G8_10685, partial [Anaerolineae bacterium]
MHVLQSPYWRALKTQFGWSGRGVSLPGCGGETQVLFRRLPPGFNLAYVPKGPDLNWRDEAAAARALQTLTRAAR